MNLPLLERCRNFGTRCSPMSPCDKPNALEDLRELDFLFSAGVVVVDICKSIEGAMGRSENVCGSVVEGSG